jgi:hypothetical protein
MPTHVPLYHAVYEHLHALTRPSRVRATSVRRLALLVTGLLAAKSCVLAQVAAELFALRLTRAAHAESLERRLRRTLNDGRLDPRTCYEPALRAALDWPALLRGRRQAVLVVDESSQAARWHLLRVGLAYWGGCLPLAWSVWPQNTPLAPGVYWAALDALLTRVAALLPPGLPVVVTADRAYDVPPFVDRVAASGWHWVVRAKANGTLRWRDRRGREQGLRALVRQRVRVPGMRWKGRGQVFKGAGWREASVLAVWAAGQAERLVVLSDLPPQWAVLRLYDRRFWIEPGFRADKRKGWQWEQSQVQGVAHHERLLLALAWASLLVLSLGVQAAQARLAARGAHPGRPPRPQHPRQSLFTLGLRWVRQWLYRVVDEALPCFLPALDAPSWHAQWLHHQAQHLIFGQSVRP